MLRLLTPEPGSAAIDSEQKESSEFEIVLGRRQMASLGFVALVALAVCSGVSYIAGRAAGAKQLDPPRAAAVAEPAKAAPTALVETPAPAATPAPAPSPTPAPQAPPAPPSLYGEPVPGSSYIQLGSVDRGVAEIMVEGLRARGFAGLIAPGPTEKTFRVLVGPFRSTAEYQETKTAIDKLGAAAFTRTYGQ